MPSPRTAHIAAVGLLWAAVAACGDAGGLQKAGAAPTAVSPARPWPSLTPASSPAWDYDEAETEIVKGVRVPGDDIRAADPVAVVRAEIAAHPEDYAGAKAPYRETARLVRRCGTGEGLGEGGDARGGAGEARGEGGGREACPLLEPYYRDVTGDGHEEMTLGFSLLPAKMTAVRVYTVDDRHRLVRVMENDDAVSAVELAGRSVIIRAPSEVPGYEYRLQWTWDPDQRVMLLTHDEMLRTGRRERPVRPSHTPGTPHTPGSPHSPRPSRSAGPPRSSGPSHSSASPSSGAAASAPGSASAADGASEASP
ncbi:MAG TPA: hypothetical protein VFP69_21815 [Streptomyces sp.]|nr:hypothetical protein [Streptomyces sp.]